MRQRWRKTYRNYSRFNPDNERQYYQFGAVPYTGKKKFRGFTDENPRWTGKDLYRDYMKKRHEKVVEVSERQDLEQWMRNVYDNLGSSGYGVFMIENLDRFDRDGFDRMRERHQQRRENQRSRNLRLVRNGPEKKPSSGIFKPVSDPLIYSEEKASNAVVYMNLGGRKEAGDNYVDNGGAFVYDFSKVSIDGKEFTNAEQTKERQLDRNGRVAW